MNYRQTLDYLYNSLADFQQDGVSAYKPGLERVVEFNRHLELPDRNFCSIHIAGTNGKGSVSHIIASVLISAGYRVGLYTSPHIKDFRERIKVDGIEISEAEVIDFVRQHKIAMEELHLSFFEMTVGMAFDHFSRSGVEVAVVETGLGGRLDATNIIRPVLSIITNIGLDHQSLLGDNAEKIAVEKAGIIKKRVPVVIGESDSCSSPIFIEKAMQEHSPLVFADTMFSVLCDTETDSGRQLLIKRHSTSEDLSINLDLHGRYQRQNIVTALAAIEVLNRATPVSVSRRAILEGAAVAAASTGLHGRWEVLGRQPLIVCDTGHNEHGFDEILPQLAGFTSGKLYMVLGFVEDKDISGILSKLPNSAYYIFTQPSVRRALSATSLAALAMASGLNGEIAANVPQALAKAKSLAGENDMIFIGGSTFVVADINI